MYKAVSLGFRVNGRVKTEIIVLHDKLVGVLDVVGRVVDYSPIPDAAVRRARKCLRTYTWSATLDGALENLTAMGVKLNP